VSEYDDLIERAASRLAQFILHPTPENEVILNGVILQAVTLRSGRADGLVARGDVIGVWSQVVQVVGQALKHDDADAADVQRALIVLQEDVKRIVGCG
jgi:hypothetical protein